MTQTAHLATEPYRVFHNTPLVSADIRLLAWMQDQLDYMLTSSSYHIACAHQRDWMTERTEGMLRMLEVWGEESTGDLLGISPVVIEHWRQGL